MAGEEELQIDSRIEREIGGNLMRTRIYVGGLGGTVTEDDIRKTFSPLGILESVEIVRTKNRSFAYLDFLPSSEKSLAKLFSTYNGCMWKGGRLRLEKAKEHYLVRLKREWIEAAQLATKAPSSNPDVSEITGSFEKPKKVPAVEKPQLRFFFPKLMKMKSLPFTGTGKHKYSFQRVEVPSLPVHFCDCEEHSNPSETIKEKSFGDVETERCGINEQELDMMNSVMNKLFEKKNCAMDTGGRSQSANEGGILSSSIDDMHVDEHEENDMHVDETEDNQADSDAVSDEDNIVLNIVAGGNDRITSSGRKEKITGYQEWNLNKPQASKQKAAQKMHEHEERKIIPYDKKRKPPPTEESEGNDISSSAPRKKNLSKTSSSDPADRTTSTQQSTHFSSSQKPRWKNLVGERENTQFSISQILPDIPSSKEHQPEINKFIVSNSTEIKEQNIVKHGKLESQLPLHEMKEPEINNAELKEDLLKVVSAESQLGTSKKVKELDEAAPVVPSAVPSSTSGRGAAWKQKSSWTQLISNTSTSSFSISQVLPGLTFESQRAIEEPNLVDAVKSKDNKRSNKPKPDSSGTFEVAKVNLVGPDIGQSSSEKKSANVEEKNESPLTTKQPLVGEIWNGETCPFMRSEASMKEWMKTKAALSGSMKKKVNEK